MSSNDKQIPRKQRNLNDPIDENNLWDLQDDWDDTEMPDSPYPSDLPKNTAAPPRSTTATLAPEPEKPLDPNPEYQAATDTQASAPQKKLQTIEKITLTLLALALIGAAAWGCIWLNGKNKMAHQSESIQLPAKGQYTTITQLTTTWLSPKQKLGVNMNAVVVPSVHITLDPNNRGEGALRLYFQNSNKESIGDTITIPFSNGKFSNGSNSIEAIASDGFHQEGLFYAYQVENTTPWRIRILEAPSASSPGSEFTEIVNAPVSTKRQ